MNSEELHHRNEAVVVTLRGGFHTGCWVLGRFPSRITESNSTDCFVHPSDQKLQLSIFCVTNTIHPSCTCFGFGEWSFCPRRRNSFL